MNATRSTARKKATVKKKTKPVAKPPKKKTADAQKRKKQKKQKKRRGENLQPALRECVNDALVRYFNDMGEHDPKGMFRLVMDEVEAPLLAAVMQHCEGNQTRAATILGINRATLRKKLRVHQIT